jgi:hypothetical protein
LKVVLAVALAGRGGCVCDTENGARSASTSARRPSSAGARGAETTKGCPAATRPQARPRLPCSRRGDGLGLIAERSRGRCR